MKIRRVLVAAIVAIFFTQVAVAAPSYPAQRVVWADTNSAFGEWCVQNGGTLDLVVTLGRSQTQLSYRVDVSWYAQLALKFDEPGYSGYGVTNLLADKQVATEKVSGIRILTLQYLGPKVTNGRECYAFKIAN